jgi:predicted transporter
MILAILSILIGLSFLSAALLEIAGHWGSPFDVGIGVAGTVISLMLIFAGIAILRRWRHARQVVITAAGCTMVFTAIAGSLHFMGTVAVALGTRFPIALLVGHLRGERGEEETGANHHSTP